MQLLKSLRERFHRNRSEYDDEQDDSSNDWEQVVYARNNVDIHDTVQRREYVRGCLEQMADASKEIDSLTYEYNMVTSYLRDMEEIEALPKSERDELNKAADNVVRMQSDRARSVPERAV